MSLHIYKSYCLVAEKKSISQAAKLLHASQPTIGSQIKSLEQEYAVTLLNRSNQGVELTKAGEIVYTYARKMLHLQEQLEKEIALILSTENNCLKIGADRTVGNYVLPYLLSDFKRKHPSIKIEMKIMPHKPICEQVLNKQIHIGIIDGPFQCCTLPEYIKCGQISDDKIHLVASPQLKNLHSPLSVEDLKRVPLIMPSKDLKIREVIDQNLQQKLAISIKDLNVVYELNSIPAIKSYVFAGCGAAFFCDISINRDIKTNQLQIYDIDGLDMRMTYYLIYHQQCITDNLTNLVSFLVGKKKNECTKRSLNIL